MNNEETIRRYAMQVKLLAEEDGGGFEALFPQIARSIVGYGETQQEAVDDLLSAIPAFLQVMEDSKQKLPVAEGPKEWNEYSGKFNVRVAKILHAKMVRLADEQGVSLNSLVQTILMSAATALDSGHEFGAIVESAPELQAVPLYNWQAGATSDRPRLTIEDCDNLPKERNPDDWKIASEN